VIKDGYGIDFPNKQLDKVKKAADELHKLQKEGKDVNHFFRIFSISDLFCHIHSRMFHLVNSLWIPFIIFTFCPNDITGVMSEMSGFETAFDNAINYAKTHKDTLVGHIHSRMFHLVNSLWIPFIIFTFCG
jgi:hypothetical protein